MKQIGRCIEGDAVKIENITKNWFQFYIHPATFYGKYDKFTKAVKKTKGLYSEIDYDRNVVVKFQMKEDAILFQRHYEYAAAQGRF